MEISIQKAIKSLNPCLQVRKFSSKNVLILLSNVIFTIYEPGTVVNNRNLKKFLKNLLQSSSISILMNTAFLYQSALPDFYSGPLSYIKKILELLIHGQIKSSFLKIISLFHLVDEFFSESKVLL